LYFPFEAAAPFVPWMAYVYASVNGLLLLPLFVLDRKGIGRLGRAFAAATLVAAGFHLAVPADLGWERHAADEQRLLAAIYAVDRPHNLFPSLHVAYSTLAALAVWRSGRAAWVRAGAAVWLAALAASVVLVRQHHLMDVAGGLWLGAAGAGAFGLGQPRNSEKRPLPH
jgi:membrane-associated phospholipid phosphatase